MELTKRLSGHDLTVRLSGKLITYDDYGPVYAPAVIFVHAFPFNRHMWDLQTEGLKNNFRVISFDFPDQIKNGADVLKSGEEALSNDLLLLMDHLQIPKAAICGWSAGCGVALKAIQEHPSRFSALILSDCGPRPKQRTYKKLEEAIGLLRTGNVKKFAEECLQHLMALIPGRERTELEKAAAQMITATPPSAICKILEDLPATLPATAIEKLSVPVMMMIGEFRTEPANESPGSIKEKIPGVYMRIIHCAGCLPNLENSEEFNNQLSGFMEKYGIRRSLSQSVYHS